MCTVYEVIFNTLKLAMEIFHHGYIGKDQPLACEIQLHLKIYGNENRLFENAGIIKSTIFPRVHSQP